MQAEETTWDDRTRGDVAGSLSGSRVGRYELLSFLGRGGMADVYAARCTTTLPAAGTVAIKRMLPRLAVQPRLVEWFLHEAELTSRFEHPNLVRCVDFGTAGGVPFMALEFIDGIPCDVLQRSRLAGRLPRNIALGLIRSVLDGLVYAHEAKDEQGRSLGIVHLDVSPENILLSRDGEVRLTDFGVAQSAFTLGPSASQELRGKIGYMSPEQIRGLPMDQRSDVFSVGVVLAELLFGRHAFHGKDSLDLLVRNYSRKSDALSEIARSEPSPLAELVHTATARHPPDRFQSTRDFLSALHTVADALGSLPTGQELAAWLVEEGLVPRKSGVFERPGSSTPVGDIWERIDAARATRGPGQREQAREPRARTTPVPPASRQSLRVRAGSGLPTEDCSFARVVERLVTGSAGLHTVVAVDDGPFGPLGDIPALARVARVPAYRFNDGASRTQWSVPLERGRIPSLLHVLASGGACGVLSLTAGSRQKRIYFDGGHPVFVASTDSCELLGHRLIELGLIDVHELEDIVTAATQAGRRVGQALVAGGILSAGNVLRLLVTELEHRVLEISCWTGGEVSFTTGARPGREVPTELAPPSVLACQLVRQAYCDHELTSFLPQEDAPLTAAQHGSSIALRALLTDHELAVIDRAAGEACNENLVERLAVAGIARPEQSRRALFLGLSLGLLASPAWWRLP